MENYVALALLVFVLYAWIHYYVIQFSGWKKRSSYEKFISAFSILTYTVYLAAAIYITRQALIKIPDALLGHHSGNFNTYTIPLFLFHAYLWIHQSFIQFKYEWKARSIYAKSVTILLAITFGLLNLQMALTVLDSMALNMTKV